MDICIDMVVRIRAKRVGPGGPEYAELQKYLWNAVDAGILEGNEWLADTNRSEADAITEGCPDHRICPWRLEITGKEVVSR